MRFDFRNLINRLSAPMEVTEDTGGKFDYEDGGRWKPVIRTKTITAAAFNLNSRDIRGYGINYGEGGAYTTEDIKIYAHEPITIGSVVEWKGSRFTVSSQIDHSDYASGLRLYIARRAGKIRNAPDEE